MLAGLVIGWDAQIRQIICLVPIDKFSPSCFLDIWRELSRHLTAIELLSSGIGKAFNHRLIVTPDDTNAKSYYLTLCGRERWVA
jgi:hypothetical protein